MRTFDIALALSSLRGGGVRLLCTPSKCPQHRRLKLTTQCVVVGLVFLCEESSLDGRRDVTLFVCARVKDADDGARSRLSRELYRHHAHASLKLT